MTVAELIEKLKKLPLNSQVILQKDAEGNGYSPLDSVDGDAIYQPESTYAGDIVRTDQTWEEACWESEEGWEQFKAGSPRCCVLVPVN